MFKSWITNGTAAPFYARKQFPVKKEVKSAIAKVCGLGQFVFHMNGQKAGDHELDPGWTDYDKLVQYVTFDVTGMLMPGENVLGAEVGNGWYHKMDEHYTFAFPPFMPPNPNGYHPYAQHLVLALELEIRYADGTEERIEADESFRVREHPIVMSNVYGSETIDHRLSVPGWCEVGYDDSGWAAASLAGEEDIPKGEPIDQFQPAVKVINRYEGRFLHRVNGRDIYDFGQNLSGLLDFEIMGKPGESVRIYPAEKLGPDGDVDQMAKNWIPVDSCITAIVGQEDTWEHCRMTFAYFAGRYVAVETAAARAGFSDTCGEVLEPVVSDSCEAPEAAGSGLPVSEDAAMANSDQADMSEANPVPADTLEKKAKAPETAGPQIRALCADAVTSAHKTDGSFLCDDDRYNRIYDMIEKTVEANMTSGVHTDCPTIERFAWQEPNHLMASAIFYMKDGKRLWEKFLLDMRAGQHTADDWFHDGKGGKYYPGEGLMPAQCPCFIPNVLPVPGLGDMYDIIAWGSTCILGTYWHYLFYGDIKIIEDNYDAGMRYLEHLKSRVNADGFINYGLGDWGNPRGDYARENIETAFLYADAVTLAKFAGLLGKPEDQAELERYAKEVKENYNEKLLTVNPGTGGWCYRCADHSAEFYMTQASQALPLFWGMVPEEKEADVVNAFRETLEREGAFIAGEVGLPYVIQTARRYGMNALISRFILREEHPSYYAFILDGETTLGEYWESNPRSHCHDMMGHIIEWYYNGIAGILPEQPGFKEVTIRPYLPETIHGFTCSYQSVSGEIRVHVKETSEKILLEVHCADGIHCHIDSSNLEERRKPVEIVQN
ncbi:MAG: glycoside hydrolase family 78 protein [Lachnospiraceae bacterium]|nr:glycoside hydrolase family 78 protein [Lachnospiraceae bacterium]